MKLDFQEKHDFWTYGGPISYPMIRVRLIGHHGQIAETYALLDSGADYCLFHADWARRIGLDLYSGRPDCLGGIDPKSKTQVYYHRINLIIGESHKVRCDVGFSEDVGTEMEDQLIGRTGLFDKIRFAFRQRTLSAYSGREP